jgi:hypothetical protein
MSRRPGEHQKNFFAAAVPPDTVHVRTRRSGPELRIDASLVVAKMEFRFEEQFTKQNQKIWQQSK